MPVLRLWAIVPLFALLPLLASCVQDEVDHNPLQTVAIDLQGGDLGALEGRWYARGYGDLAAVVRAGRQPTLSIRMYPQQRLESARLDGESLRLQIRHPDGLYHHWLEPMPQGGLRVGTVDTGWCCTCDYLVRYPLPWKTVAEHLYRISEATWDWLVDTL